MSRKTRDKEPKPPTISEARCCAFMYSALISAHARSYVGGHPHGLKHLGIASAGFRQTHSLRAVDTRRHDRGARRDLGQEGDEDQDHGARHSGYADPKMEDKADGKIERHPWQVEERRWAGARKKAAHLVEIVQGLQSPDAAALQRQRGENVVDAMTERFIEPSPDPHQSASANEVEHGLERHRA